MICLLGLLVLVEERLDSWWQLGHELLEPGLHNVGAVVHGLVNGLLVQQVELGHGEGTHQQQDEQRERVEDTADAVEHIEQDESKARSEDVVPENDALGLVDDLVNVRLEPVGELLHALLWQGEVSRGQFVDPGVVEGAKDAIVESQVEAIEADHGQRGQHEEARDAEEGERGERDEREERREEDDARVAWVLPQDQVANLWWHIDEIEPAE